MKTWRLVRDDGTWVEVVTSEGVTGVLYGGVPMVPIT